MMKTGTLEYQKKSNFQSTLEKRRPSKELNVKVTKEDLILLLSAFFIGRTPVIGGIMPLGILLFTSSYKQNRNKFLVALLISAGILTSGSGKPLYMALASMLLFSILTILIKPNKSAKEYAHSIIASISVMVPLLVYVYTQGFLLYDFILTLFCGIAVFFLNYIFMHGVKVISNFNRKRIFTSEEVISGAIIGALILSGLSGILIFGFPLSNILCMVFLLIMSFRFGPAVGAATGVAMGIILNMSSDVTPLAIGIYALCGLLSGLFKNLGKVGSSLGFVLGNIFLTLYLSGSSHGLVFLKDIILAAGIFILLPIPFMEKLTGSFKVASIGYEDNPGYGLRIREITVERLDKFSKVFKEISKTFDQISESKAVTGKEDISVMFDRVVDKVCKDCSLCMYCWDRNFYSTYQVLFKIIENLDSKGRINQEDIPPYFIERCERIEDFVDAVNNTFEIFKVDLVWKNKIGESRGLISQQLLGLSKIIGNLSSEIGVDIHFKKDIEEAVERELNNSGAIKVSHVNVYENERGRNNITIFHKGCGGRRICSSLIEKIVSEVMGTKMVREKEDCNFNYKENSCSLRLVEEEPYRVTTAVAKVAKAECPVSGDNYTFMNSGDGKYIVALSDGMGAGHKAYAQSKATIGLLEQFIEAGFDKDTAVKFINSILLLKSGDDSFATIDLSVIDLYNGEIEFVKIGAVPTFIKKSSRVEVIRSASLPVGILSNLEFELVHKNMGDGDILIMMSDGVLDAFSDDWDSEKVLLKYIQSIDTINPQKIADTILSQAYSKYGENPKDDMLVVVAKVWKKAG